MQLTAFLYPLFGYILGSLPFALWVIQIVKGTDIRDAGSGHVTTTNTIRQAGWLPGVLVALLDIAKGSVGEVRSMYRLALKLNFIADDVCRLRCEKCMSITKQPSGFTKYLRSK